MRTVVDAIADQAGGSGTLTMLAADGQVATSLPWSAAHQRARRIASVPAGTGVGRGRRVGVLGDTSVDLVTALQAMWLCGAAVTVLPPPTRRPENLQAIAADADLDLVVASEPADGLPRTKILALADLAPRRPGPARPCR